MDLVLSKYCCVLMQMQKMTFLSSCFTYAKKREMFKERPAVVIDAVVL